MYGLIFTTITTAYNTGNVTEYNVVAADKYNQTNESTGFTDGKFEVWGRRFSLPEMRRQQMRAMWHSTRQPAIATGMTATSTTLGGGATLGRPLRTLPRRRTGAS